MRAGEIYLAMFPLGDVPGMKLRPVLLLTGRIGPVPEVLVAYISSIVPVSALPTDILLDPAQPDMAATHLKVVSMLRLHKLATIHTDSLSRRLGVLSARISSDVSNRLRTLLSL